MKLIINYITDICYIFIGILSFIFIGIKYILIGIKYILTNILHNIFMLLTTHYKYLYFEETIEEKQYLDEIDCYCNLCITTKYICNCFAKKLSKKNEKHIV